MPFEPANLFSVSKLPKADERGVAGVSCGQHLTIWRKGESSDRVAASFQDVDQLGGGDFP